MFYVINDSYAKVREAFVIAEDKIDTLKDYSGYYTVNTFGSKKEAEKFCNSFNTYQGEPAIELWCCTQGCKMSAYEYAYSLGNDNSCPYEGM